MCVRFAPLKYDEAEAVLSAREHGGNALSESDFNPVYDAYPGSDVPIYVWDSRLDRLVTKRMRWGFDFDGKRDGLFNTRIETVLEQLNKGRRGFWRNLIVNGRCLVPVRAFYEGHRTERLVNRETGRTIKRWYRFTLSPARAFLLAGVQDEGRFSVVTTAPNKAVERVHDRMPLVLGRGESCIWLGEGYASLVDRSRIQLATEPEL